MIAVDTNILVYAHRLDSTLYQAAKTVLQNLIEGRTPWSIPWSCVHEFYAVVTHPRIYNPPTPVDQTLSQIEALLECPSLNCIGESPDYWILLKKLLGAGKIMGPRVHDGRIVAVCLANGIDTLLSCDRDFSRFEVSGLKVVNPLLTQTDH